ncbi:MAG: signal recognition particle-docking protein FtsY [Candidatus Micrarchaeia archaeon]
MFDNLRKKLSDAVNIFSKKEKKDQEVNEEESVENKKNNENITEVFEEVIDKETEESAKKEETSNEIPVSTNVDNNTKQENISSANIEKNTANNKANLENSNKPKEEREIATKRNAQKIKKEDEEKRIKIDLSLSTKLKSVLIKNIMLNENEVDNFLENIKLLLLKSDVSFDTTDDFIEEMKANLISAKFDSKNLQKELIGVIRTSLYDILKRNDTGINILQFIKNKILSNELPVKILFLGPNGTGKTTTIAKIAYLLKNNNISSCLSASDTFRAAAIEQSVYHADKVGIPVIKSTYGADPASVAFDAIAYAKSHSIQVVLIDSAGRQDTNKNLINEMQKIVRISKPDLTIFVGESTAGNALAEQISEFNKFIKIDGIILTKLDCDAKGGNALSIAHETGIPVLFFGTGEDYSALVPYSINFIIDAIAPAA